MRDFVILGIQDGHDASAALVVNGHVVFAASEERFRRLKSAGGFPAGAVDACFRFSGLSPKDINHVAVAGTRAVPVNLLGTVSTLNIADHYRIQEEVRRPRYYEGKFVPFANALPNFQPKGVGYPLDRVPLKESQELTPEERAALAEFRLSFIAEQVGVPRSRVTAFEKANQALYARMLHNRNWGGVWRDIPLNRKTIRPRWLAPLRLAAKLAHAPLGADRWHRFERRFFQYWMDTTCNAAVVPYGRAARDARGARNGVSWLGEAYLVAKGIAPGHLIAGLSGDAA